MATAPQGLTPDIADARTIAVELDDTLNNFTETLQHSEFPYNPADSLSKATFEQYLQRIRTGKAEAGDILNTPYSYFRSKIHMRCWQQARARPDGAEFMRWLKRNRWRIVICTDRDLRTAYDCTKAWLRENDIPFDYLFMTPNKTVFCRAWGIRHLVGGELSSIVHGKQYGVNVYYPILPERPSLPPHNARGFQAFEEVKQWIEE